MARLLVHGPIVERSVLELRSYVTQPMQVGPLYLAGDAAHIVTPAGGKGMNLALQDVAELVAGIIGFTAREAVSVLTLQLHPPAEDLASCGVLALDAPHAACALNGHGRGRVP